MSQAPMHRDGWFLWIFIWLAGLASGLSGAAPDELRQQATWQEMIQADWLAQEEILAATNHPAQFTAAEDAAGGCDGIKNGRWGFHTGHADRPWWQVDLGNTRPIARILVWNRCDDAGSAARSRNLVVSLSQDGTDWDPVYTHDGTVFFGFSDQKPLEIRLTGRAGRFVRLHLPSPGYLHLDEVELFGPDDPARNLALHCPAGQVSLSQWSTSHRIPSPIDWAARVGAVLSHSHRLASELEAGGLDVRAAIQELDQWAARLRAAPAAEVGKEWYLQVRWLQRKLALANPLLDFDAMLITKRVPGTFNHMCDQYYGWWSRPGGGIFLLKDFKGPSPTTECLTGGFKEPGSFLRPTLSYDGRKVLFAWCRHYPHLAAEPNKLDKGNVPEDAFYHLYEMNLDGTGVRQLTRGKYDDFDGRYLPDGRIVFLSTRRGQFIQVNRQSAAQTLAQPDLPDCYVRCGGDASRPVAVYTLHTMRTDGSGLCAISPFEMFEWEPSVAEDGSILYARWDYIDRNNMPYMSLWSTHPDGTQARLVYGNYSLRPHCTFEPQSIPNSHRIVFTASAHHAHTMGSLVLLDPARGLEGDDPITRLTPEVAFPEAESWPKSSYASPWPLSERFYLVAWGNEGAMQPGPEGWDRWHAVLRPSNGMGIFLFDAAGNLEPLYRDPEITCMYPIPARPRPVPPVIAEGVNWEEAQEGRFLVADVYRGLKQVQPGQIRALRIVAVPAKTQPWMNQPEMGVTRDDPGKCVLGTVPVEADGSAYFRVPSGVTLFFQALDGQGLALQTMRSATHAQPGQTVSCIGCHEHRGQAPAGRLPLAAQREPSKISVSPSGSWPLRFEQLVQPVLDRHCVSCHNPDAQDNPAAQPDLTPAHAYHALVQHGQPSLADLVLTGYRQGRSGEGQGLASRSKLLETIQNPQIHPDLKLDSKSLERLVIWMDTYAQKKGSFSPEQEQRLEALRATWASLLIEQPER